MDMNMTKTTKTTDHFFDTLLKTMQTLSQMMEEETRLLAKQDMVGLKRVHEEKSRLVSDYSSGIKEIAMNPSLLDAAPRSLRGALKKEGEILASISHKNSVALRGAVQGTKRLIQTVVDMVKQENAFPQRYTDPAVARTRREETMSPCSPVACNRTA